MRASEIVRAGMARLTKGWCQNTAGDHEGNVCAVGSIRIPVTGSPWAMPEPFHPMSDQYSDALNALNKLAREHNFVCMSDLNDKTDKEFVLTCMEKSAIQLEEIGR